MTVEARGGGGRGKKRASMGEEHKTNEIHLSVADKIGGKPFRFEIGSFNRK